MSPTNAVFVNCTVWTRQDCSVQCLVYLEYSKRFTVLQWIVYWLKCALYCVNRARHQCTVSSVHCALCSVHCALCTVHCALCCAEEARLQTPAAAAGCRLRLQTALPTSSLHSSLHFQTFANLHIIHIITNTTNIYHHLQLHHGLESLYSVFMGI